MRKNLLDLFENLSFNFQTYRNNNLEKIALLFEKLNTREVNSVHNNLIYSKDLALRQQQTLQHLFDKNKFCAIAKMSKQYEAFIEGLKYLQFETDHLLEMTDRKRQSLDTCKEQVTQVIHKVNKENFANFEKMTKDMFHTPEELDLILKKEKAITEDIQKTSQMMQTPFYHFMVEMKPKVEELAPDLKYLEVVAFI